MLALFLKKDWEDRGKQMVRMGREESLAACKVELATGKSLQLGRLRGFCRPVIFAGTSEQVAAARDAAEPFKEELMRRGVFIVPVILPAASGAATGEGLGPLDTTAVKWEGRPIRSEEWKTWYD